MTVKRTRPFAWTFRCDKYPYIMMLPFYLTIMRCTYSTSESCGCNTQIVIILMDCISVCIFTTSSTSSWPAHIVVTFQSDHFLSNYASICTSLYHILAHLNLVASTCIMYLNILCVLPTESTVCIFDIIWTNTCVKFSLNPAHFYSSYNVHIQCLGHVASIRIVFIHFH